MKPLHLLLVIGLAGCGADHQKPAIAMPSAEESAFDSYNTCLSQHMSQPSGCEPERKVYEAALKHQSR